MSKCYRRGHGLQTNPFVSALGWQIGYAPACRMSRQLQCCPAVRARKSEHVSLKVTLVPAGLAASGREGFDSLAQLNKLSSATEGAPALAGRSAFDSLAQLLERKNK